MKRLAAIIISAIIVFGTVVPAFAYNNASASIQVQSVSAGTSHCAVVDQNGVLWMWGANGSGQFGNGTKDGSLEPIKIMDGVSSVSCGSSFTAVIKSDRTLWTMGSNVYGELGNGGDCDGSSEWQYGVLRWKTQPTMILDDVIFVSCGDYYGAAVRSDGTLWMWGMVSRFGHGVDGNDVASYTGGMNPIDIQTTPVKVEDHVTTVSCGGEQTLIIKDDGNAWEWHVIHSVYAAVTDTASEPTKIMDDALMVTSGSHHAAIVKADGTLWMYGSNWYGELGDGTTISVDTPFKLMDNVEEAVAGDHITMARKTDGTLWVWGLNRFKGLVGGLGNNLSKESNVGGFQDVPIQIMDRVAIISSGDDYQIVIKTDGTVWTWGTNDSGQLGNGGSGNVNAYILDYHFKVQSYPVQIGSDVLKVSTVMIKTDTISCTPSTWAEAEVNAAIAAGLVPENLQQNYQVPVSRGDVARMFINLIEKSSGKDIANIMDEKGVQPNVGAFTDTNDKAVLEANALGIINGVGNNKYDPDGTFTRAQIAAIINRIARVLGVETEGYSHSFTDVAGHWVYSELGWPSSVGIINGVGNNKFDPDSELTTEQAIAITYRALQVLKR